MSIPASQTPESIVPSDGTDQLFVTPVVAAGALVDRIEDPAGTASAGDRALTVDVSATGISTAKAGPAIITTGKARSRPNVVAKIRWRQEARTCVAAAAISKLTASRIVDLTSMANTVELPKNISTRSVI